MKKIISMMLIVLISIMCFSTINSYAATLDTINIDVNKQIVRPGEEVKLTINFGEALSEYTFNIAYDNKLFEYVSVDGGTATVDGETMKVVFSDATNARQNMSIIFKAKSGLETSNPTELTVVGTNLKKSGSTENFDDITTPMVKNVTVEPEYKDYTITFEPTEGIKKDEEKDMTLTFASSMGRFYEHARLIAIATTPEGATVKINAVNEQEKVTQDIIQSGWGDPQGYKIGGKDFSQVLKVKTIFNKEGEYKITFKLIDRDNADSVIAEKQFNFTIGSELDGTSQNKPNTDTVGKVTNQTQTATNKMPTSLPKAGYNIYIPIAMLILGLISFSVYYNIKSKK